MHKKLVLSVSFCCLVLTAAIDRTYAYSGQTGTYNIPIGIPTIDGIISPGEWDDATWYNMDQTYYGSPTDLSQAKWKAMWSPATNLIYVAVTGVDTQHHFNTSNVAWNAQDDVEIYIDAANSNNTSYFSRFDYAQQYVCGPKDASSGQSWCTLGSSALPGSIVISYASKVSGNTYVYEFALTPYQFYAGIVGGTTTIRTLAAGQVLGLDVVMSTKTDSSFGMLCQNTQAGKSSDASKLLDVTLILGSGGTPLAFNPSPANSATNASIASVLSWSRHPRAASHNVYFGTNFTDVDTATDPSVLPGRGNQTATTYNPGGLAFGTAYYWRIDEVNSPDVWKGTTWSFTTDSGKATSSKPANAGTSIAPCEKLRWVAGSGATSHDVYLGTNAAAVTNATTASPEYKGNFDTNSIDPGCYVLGTTYFWRIDEVGATTVKGDTWNFTTVFTYARGTADLNGDGVVDEKDVRIFCRQWLTGGCTAFDCADLDDSNSIDFADYAVLAGNWRTFYQAQFPLWTVDGMQRVSQTAAAGTGTVARIYAAKREWEPFQIIVKGPASENLTVNSVTLSDLTGPGGATIAKSNIVLYRETYLNVTHGSNQAWGLPNLPLGPGLYADGLIPFVNPANGQPIVGASLEAIPFTAAANQCQPIWVDVFVPADAVAGVYTGTAALSTSKGPGQIQIELHVWNFQLPERPYCRSLWSNTYHGSCAQLFLDHRIMTADVASTAQWSKINMINTGPYSGASVGNCTMSAAPTAASYTTRQNSYPSSMASYLVDYSADEIGGCSSLYPTIQAWGLNMHTGSSIKNLITMSPVSALFTDGGTPSRPAVDVWVILPVMNASLMPTAINTYGCEGWSYNTLVQDNYSPKWQIDFRPIEFRILTWVDSKLGYTGLLYWANDKWENTTNYLTDWQTCSLSTPGDGWMVYPGSPVGLTADQPSMRLKWLREGMDDYDYIQILKNLGDTTWAMTQVNTVGPDWTNWTRDTNVMLNARKAMGDRIEQLMNP